MRKPLPQIVLVAVAVLAIIDASCALKPRTAALSSIRAPSRIEITRQGDPFAVILTRDGRTWSLAVGDDRRYPVNETRMAAFLSCLTERRPFAFVGSKNARDYGIGTVGSYAVSVSGEGNGGVDERIDFGDADATGEWQYFSRHEDGGIYRAPSAVAQFLDVRASTWAELSPYRTILASFDVQEIIVRGKRYRAGIDPEVAAFGAALGKLAALDVTNIPADPEITVEVTFGNASRAILGFAPIGGDWILSDETTGLSWVISGGSKRELFASLVD